MNRVRIAQAMTDAADNQKMDVLFFLWLEGYL